jgi:hypothetical protein
VAVDQVSGRTRPWQPQAGTSAKQQRAARRQAKREQANYQRAGLTEPDHVVEDLDDLVTLAAQLRGVDEDQDQDGAA